MNGRQENSATTIQVTGTVSITSRRFIASFWPRPEATSASPKNRLMALQIRKTL